MVYNDYSIKVATKIKQGMTDLRARLVSGETHNLEQDSTYSWNEANRSPRQL